MPPKSASQQARENQSTEEEVPHEGVYRCPGCEKSIKSSMDAFLHPLLKCLMCRHCHDEYKTGDFSEFEDGVDEEGDDNFCRWCIDGGDLFACGNPTKCHYAFCRVCIERNMPDDPVLNNNVDSWLCYVCDPSRPKLKALRKAGQAAILHLSQKVIKPRSKDGSSSSASYKDKLGSNGGSSSTRKDKENSERTPPESPSKATRGQRRDEKGAPQGRDKDSDEASGSERKKRRTEQASSSSTAATASEQDKRDSSSKKDKDRKKVDEEVAREPESVLMPPLEKPKPPKTSLRNLGARPSGTSSTSRPSNTTQSGATKVPTLGFQLNTTKPPPIVSSAGNSISRPSIPIAGTGSKTGSQQAGSTPKIPTAITQTTPVVVIPSSATTTASISSKPRASSNVPTEGGETNKTANQFVSAPPKQAVPVPHQSLRSVSKGLKPNNELIKPTTKVPLTDEDLKARLDNFGSVIDKCVKEINIKFQNILEMFTTKDLNDKKIIRDEIDDLEKPLQEFRVVLVDLKSLQSSQA